MNNLKTLLVKLTAGLALAVGMSSTALAGPIVGSIGWAGVINDPGSDLSALTTLDFNSPAGVLLSSGDYAGTTSVDLFDVPVISPFASQVLWEGTNGAGTKFRFTMNSLTVDLQTVSDLDLDGFGIVSYVSGPGAPWTDTTMKWSFSAQSSGGTEVAYTFSADAFSPVPEPGILSLLGLGLLGLGITNRRKRVSA